MKKLLIFAVLLVFSSGAYGQAAALEVRNYNQTCGVYVVMYAAAPTEGDNPCDIRACQFHLAASTVTGYSWTSLTSFASGPGFCQEATNIPATTLATLTDWNWTDVTFQWDCPIPPCTTNAGGAMSETGGSYPLALTCESAGASWGSSCGGGTSTWTSTLSGAAMANVRIDFH